MIKILTTRIYERRLKKFKNKHPQLKEKYIQTILMLEKNPYHPSLRLHKLKGRHQEYYSISINMKYRIIIDFIIRDDKVILLDIGNHNFLYR